MFDLGWVVWIFEVNDLLFMVGIGVGIYLVN